MKIDELKKQNHVLKTCVNDLFWMARRYANGRHTTVPSTVRMWYKILKKDFPDIRIEPDDTITFDKLHAHKAGFDLDSDWLVDCND